MWFVRSCVGFARQRETFHDCQPAVTFRHASQGGLLRRAKPTKQQAAVQTDLNDCRYASFNAPTAASVIAGVLPGI